MKLSKFLFFSLLIITVLSCTKEERLDLQLHNKKVLILGNSITQHGDYVSFIEYYLKKNYPKDTLNIISIGLSSETASGDSELEHPFPRPCIHSRLDNALKLTKPDLVLACYGMNDGIYSSFDNIRFNNYKTGILNLKKKVENEGANIIFLTPTPFDASRKTVSENGPNFSYKQPYAKYNEVLKTYAEWLKTIEQTQVIDLHGYIENELKFLKSKYPDSTFILDGIHPNRIGHFYMAKKVLYDLYPKIDIADPVSEFSLLEKDSLFSLISKRRHIRSDGWLKYVGYIKKDTVKVNDINPTVEKVKQLDLTIMQTLSQTQ